MKGVMLDRASLDRGDLDLAALEATLPEWEFYDNSAPETLADRLADAAVVVSNKVVLNAKTLKEAGRLRFIGVAATGTNNVDLAAARARGIVVANVRGYATPSVVQHVLALILAHTRRLFEYRKAVQKGAWQRSEQFCLLDYPIRELEGLTLGVVGFGELGQAVARAAEAAFGMRILIAQRPGGAPQADRMPLSELLPQADVLTLHCPLTPETRGLIGADELSRMKPDALLINTARGGIVDEAALAHALRDGTLGGAAVDVLSEEPPRSGNPLLEPGIPNLVVTPHVAWASREARQRLIDQLTDNIRAFLDGRPRNVVN